MSVWDDVVGQEHVIDTLRGAVVDPRSMTHAWLFTGPPGSGRSNAARAFAAALQCEAPEGGCGHCQACTTTLAGTHADVTVLATEQVTIKIDEVRELIGRASRKPSTGRWQIIIVEDADRMLERTTNVLLKSIEEPPSQTVWLLCAPSSQDVLPTIRSRCRGVVLRVPPVQAVADLLVTRDGVEPDIAMEAARAAQSHIGLARRLARDSGARERRDEVLRIPAEVTSVGEAVIAAGRLVEVAQAEAKSGTEERDATEKGALLRALGAEPGDTLPPRLRSQITDLEKDQKRRATRYQRDVLDRAMLDLLSLYRDVLVTQLGADVDLVNVSHGATVRTLAGRSTPVRTLEQMNAISTARERLGTNVSPLLATEAMLVELRPR